VSKRDDVLVRDARNLARRLLRRQNPERWLHSQGVADRAAELAGTVRRKDRAMLIAAAWVHDIGSSPDIAATGFHPLDGALYLRDHGLDQRITELVAHHSGARFVPATRGFGPLMAEFEFEQNEVSDALAYADQTVGPGGQRMKIQDRIAEAIRRHGPNSPNAQARIDREPYLLAAAARVEKRLTCSCGSSRPAAVFTPVTLVGAPVMGRSSGPQEGINDHMVTGARTVNRGPSGQFRNRRRS
jgi:hypothetical protein